VVNAALADALRGIRVLDLSRLLPGPFLTMVLADMGADVVKVEDPRMGDYLRGMPPLHKASGMSGRFLAINRGKRSIALDLKVAAARDAFLKLVDKADVIVESFRPRVMDKLDLGYATLAARNPAIIVCSISGYGQTGPWVERAGHDLNYIATAGVLAMTGPTGGAPQMPGVQIGRYSEFRLRLCRATPPAESAHVQEIRSPTAR
jgi:crotonobetainyl-CoA:carnitine CoA-transferase CaiB-like acyl-CoA transferase